MTPADLRRLLLALPPATARDVLGEAVLTERLVACGEPGHDENATLWSLSVPDHVARLGYAVREAAFDPERLFTPEEAALIQEALVQLGAAPPTSREDEHILCLGLGPSCDPLPPRGARS